MDSNNEKLKENLIAEGQDSDVSSPLEPLISASSNRRSGRARSYYQSSNFPRRSPSPAINNSPLSLKQDVESDPLGSYGMTSNLLNTTRSQTNTPPAQLPTSSEETTSTSPAVRPLPVKRSRSLFIMNNSPVTTTQHSSITPETKPANLLEELQQQEPPTTAFQIVANSNGYFRPVSPHLSTLPMMSGNSLELRDVSSSNTNYYSNNQKSSDVNPTLKRMWDLNQQFINVIFAEDSLQSAVEYFSVNGLFVTCTCYSSLLQNYQNQIVKRVSIFPPQEQLLPLIDYFFKLRRKGKHHVCINLENSGLFTSSIWGESIAPQFYGDKLYKKSMVIHLADDYGYCERKLQQRTRNAKVINALSCLFCLPCFCFGKYCISTHTETIKHSIPIRTIVPSYFYPRFMAC